MIGWELNGNWNGDKVFFRSGGLFVCLWVGLDSSCGRMDGWIHGYMDTWVDA